MSETMNRSFTSITSDTGADVTYEVKRTDGDRVIERKLTIYIQGHGRGGTLASIRHTIRATDRKAHSFTEDTFRWHADKPTVYGHTFRGHMAAQADGAPGSKTEHEEHNQPLASMFYGDAVISALSSSLKTGNDYGFIAFLSRYLPEELGLNAQF